MSTNDRDTFITVAADCPAIKGEAPAKPDSVAGLQHALLIERPYTLTSDDLLFEIHARRNGIAKPDRAEARRTFFAKPQACLRASPLVKRHGFGLHHDGEGRVAAYGVETQAYRRLASDSSLRIVAGMRSRRA